MRAINKDIFNGTIKNVLFFGAAIVAILILTWIFPLEKYLGEFCRTVILSDFATKWLPGLAAQYTKLATVSTALADSFAVFSVLASLGLLLLLGRQMATPLSNALYAPAVPTLTIKRTAVMLALSVLFVGLGFFFLYVVGTGFARRASQSGVWVSEFFFVYLATAYFGLAFFACGVIAYAKKLVADGLKRS